jgi:hypothetical protein
MGITYNRAVTNGQPPISAPSATALALPNAVQGGKCSPGAPAIQGGRAYTVYMAADGYRCAVVDLASASLVKSFVVDPVCDQAPQPDGQGYADSRASSWVCSPYFTQGRLFCLTNHGLSGASLVNDYGCELDYASLDAVTWHLWEVDPAAGTSRHCASGPGAAKTPITFAPDGSIYFGTFCTQGSFYQYDRGRNLNAFTPDPPDRFNHEGQR